MHFDLFAFFVAHRARFSFIAAVRHLASSLAVEWATKNIRVNVISPGYMATALTRVILDRDPELRDAWVNLTPMGRIGEPEDLKGAVIYLASDASAFTTGADLRVDGGYTLVSFILFAFEIFHSLFSRLLTHYLFTTDLNDIPFIYTSFSSPYIFCSPYCSSFVGYPQTTIVFFICFLFVSPSRSRFLCKYIILTEFVLRARRVAESLLNKSLFEPAEPDQPR